MGPPPPTATTTDARRWLLLGCALCIAALYVLDGWWLRPPADGLPSGRIAMVVLLLLPMRGVWRGSGRSAFWYALLCTLPVTHALLLALDDRTRPFGLVLLALASALFIAACAFTRRHGLRPV